MTRTPKQLSKNAHIRELEQKIPKLEMRLNEKPNPLEECMEKRELNVFLTQYKQMTGVDYQNPRVDEILRLHGEDWGYYCD